MAILKYLEVGDNINENPNSHKEIEIRLINRYMLFNYSYLGGKKKSTILLTNDIHRWSQLVHAAIDLNVPQKTKKNNKNQNNVL